MQVSRAYRQKWLFNCWAIVGKWGFDSPAPMWLLVIKQRFLVSMCGTNMKSISTVMALWEEGYFSEKEVVAWADSQILKTENDLEDSMIDFL